MADLDLTIPAGSTVALLGPNGAGKSTDRQRRPRPAQPGTPARSGCSAATPQVGDLAPAAVGAMLQHGGLPSEARVGEVLGPRPAQLPPGLAARRPGGHRRHRRAARPAGRGTVRRSAPARSCSPSPWPGPRPLLLLDEPTSAMDVEGRRAFWTTMRGLADPGHTVVFATHHLEEADAVADRVVVVAGGRVVADGSAAAVKGRHRIRRISFTRRRRPPGRRSARGHVDTSARRHASPSRRPTPRPPCAPCWPTAPRCPTSRSAAPASRTPSSPWSPPAGTEPSMNPLLAFQLRRVGPQPAVPVLHRAAAGPVHRVLHEDLRRPARPRGQYQDYAAATWSR